MTTPPTRCCVPATSGRCNNAPAPYGQSRYIGPVEIAACNHPKHQAALRSLPDFQRRDGYCGADDCHKPEPTGICPDHRQLYRRHGVNVRALLATIPEVPVTEPTPEAVVEFLCEPKPPAAPQEAAGEGAPLPPVVGALDPGIADVVDLLRAEGLATTDSGDGYSKKEAIEAGEALDYAHVFIQVDQGFSATDVADIARKIPWTNYGYRVPTVDVLDRAPESAADEPEIVGVMWEKGALCLPGTTPSYDGNPFAAAGVEPTQRATTTDVLSALVGRREKQPSTPDGLAGLAARGQEPAAPGPTLADVEAELERQRERADRAEMDAIAALLDLEDSPAWDANDQPIPLAERVRAALMPGESWRAAELRARIAAMEQEIADADWILHHLGSYGPTLSLADRLLKVLTPDDRRNILELEAAEARFDIARLKARRLNPPPEGRMKEHAKKLADIEAKLAAEQSPDAGNMVG